MSEVQLELQAMAHGGDAVGRHQGKVVFVPYGIPGDVVTAEIVEDKQRFARARILAIRTPSPGRVEPLCPYFGDCGGCQWQHIDYQEQLGYKRQLVSDVIERIGRISAPPVRPVIGMDDPWHYRNNMRFGTDREGRLGLRAGSSHRIVPVDQCLILDSVLQELYTTVELDEPGLRQMTLRHGTRTGDSMVILEMEGDMPPAIDVDSPLSVVLSLSDGRDAVLVGNGFIRERIGDVELRISAGSFFQVNTPQTEVLVSIARGYLQPTGDEVLLDAYCGVGTFGLVMADEVGQVIGIEENPSAISDASINAEEHERVSFHLGKVEDVLTQVETPIDLVTLDPPRQGCHPAALGALLERTPRRIAYVSCDPATLARDLRILIDGGYELQEVQPVDMFPQTAHIEAVALLVLGSRGGNVH